MAVPVPLQLVTQALAVTIRVTGTVLPPASSVLTWIVPEYVPEDMPDAFTETVIVPGVLPVVGLAVSQGPPEVDIEYETRPPEWVILRLCDPDVEPPL